MFAWFHAARPGDMAIDLGTANTLVYVKGRGIVINEPSVVAIATIGNRKRILAVGEEAKRMIGRTPGNISAVRPMRHGVVGDFDVAQEMLKYFIRKVYKKRLFARPVMIVSVPSGATAVERRAIREAAQAAGARNHFLIEEPMAAAIGAELPVTEATGSMVVDIGGGTTGIAVLSLGGIVGARTLEIGGYYFDELIGAHIRRTHNVAIGEATAETIKKQLGSAYYPSDGVGRIMEIKGLDLVRGAPRALEITEAEVAAALAEPVAGIIEAVQRTLEETPPELVADIVDKGIVMTGGGSLLNDLDAVLSQMTGLPVILSEDPLTCGAYGAGRVLEETHDLEMVLSDH